MRASVEGRAEADLGWRRGRTRSLARVGQQRRRWTGSGILRGSRSSGRARFSRRPARQLDDQEGIHAEPIHRDPGESGGIAVEVGGAGDPGEETLSVPGRYDLVPSLPERVSEIVTNVNCGLGRESRFIPWARLELGCDAHRCDRDPRDGSITIGVG